MPPDCIRVTLVTSGDDDLCVIRSAASTVWFETTPGQPPAAVRDHIFRLFPDAIHPVWDAVSGRGTFLTCGTAPDIATFEVPARPDLR